MMCPQCASHLKETSKRTAALGQSLTLIDHRDRPVGDTGSTPRAQNRLESPSWRNEASIWAAGGVRSGGLRTCDDDQHLVACRVTGEGREKFDIAKAGVGEQ